MGSECTVSSLIHAGMKPITTIAETIRKMNTVTEPLLRARRFQLACMIEEDKISTITNGFIEKYVL
jgi:hypothetical protein